MSSGSHLLDRWWQNETLLPEIFIRQIFLHTMYTGRQHLAARKEKVVEKMKYGLFTVYSNAGFIYSLCMHLSCTGKLTTAYGLSTNNLSTKSFFRLRPFARTPWLCIHTKHTKLIMFMGCFIFLHTKTPSDPSKQ